MSTVNLIDECGYAIHAYFKLQYIVVFEVYNSTCKIYTSRKNSLNKSMVLFF